MNNTPTPRTDKCLTFDSIALCETLERELAAVTEQRDQYKAALQSADNHNHEIGTKLEIVTEQRDKYRDIASELIAIIRINVMRDTFKIATIEQVDEHLKPWIERIAAVKGGNHES